MTEGIWSYPIRSHAEDFAQELHEIGIAAFVVDADQSAGAWDVTVPAGDAIRARLLAMGLPGY